MYVYINANRQSCASCRWLSQELLASAPSSFYPPAHLTVPFSLRVYISYKCRLVNALWSASCTYHATAAPKALPAGSNCRLWSCVNISYMQYSCSTRATVCLKTVNVQHNVLVQTEVVFFWVLGVFIDGYRKFTCCFGCCGISYTAHIWL